VNRRKGLALLVAVIAAAVAALSAYAFLTSSTATSATSSPTTFPSAPSQCAASSSTPAAGACAINPPTISAPATNLGGVIDFNVKIYSNTTTGGARTFGLGHETVVLSSTDSTCNALLGSAGNNTISASSTTSTNGWWTLQPPGGTDVGGDSTNTITGTGFSTMITVNTGDAGTGTGANSGLLSLNVLVQVNNIAAVDQSPCAGKNVVATVSI
jgi:hypothetical protein